MVPVSFTIRSVNIGRPQPWAWAEIGRSSIEKHGVPGPVEVATLGLAGDQVSDTRHHGGVDQAVYAFAREDLDWWAAELGTTLRDGQFGENLTTSGYDVNEAEVGERWRVGSALLEVASVRTPVQRLQGLDGGVRPRQHRLGQAVRRRGAARALPAGDRGGRGASPATAAEVVHRPGHGVTVSRCSAP